MILPKIKEAFFNSTFYKNCNYIPNDVLLEYKNIKNHYKESKSKLKEEIKNKLFDLIRYFIIYNVEKQYLEDYILYLIEEFTLNEFKNKTYSLDENLNDIIYNLDAIKLLVDEKNYDEEFVNKNCSPEYYVKNPVDKNRLKTNTRMTQFFEKEKIKNNIYKEKLKLNYNVDNYLDRFKDLNNALHDSIKYNHSKSIKYIINNYGCDSIYIKALNLSCQYGNINIVKLMVQKYLDIKSLDENPIKLSSKNGHYEIVEYLIQIGVNIHIMDDCALKVSSDNGHYNIVKLLIEHGADVKAGDNYAIRIASDNGHYKIVKLLIENGADVQAGDNYALKYSSGRACRIC